MPSREAQVSQRYVPVIHEQSCVWHSDSTGFFQEKCKKKMHWCIFLWSPSILHRAECLPFTRMNPVTSPSQRVVMSAWIESEIEVMVYFSQRTLQAAASAWTYLQPASFWLESCHLPLCSWGHAPRACTLPHVFLLPASLLLLNRRNTFCPGTLPLWPVLPLFSYNNFRPSHGHLLCAIYPHLLVLMCLLLHCSSICFD